MTYFIALGRPPLINPDEPRYAEVAREMWQRADFITPTLGGRAWFEKPALLYWLMMASYSTFGVSEFSARFASAGAGVLTVLVVGWMGGQIARAREKESRKTNSDKRESIENVGRETELHNHLSSIVCDLSPVTCHFDLICAAVAAASGGLLVFARGATFDILLTLTLTATLACFLTAEISVDADQQRARTNLLCAGFFAGIGASLLAKGLVGIVIPCGVIAVYILLRRKLSNAATAFLRRAWWGVPLMLLIAASWYAPVIARHGWRFVDEFFVQHHFARYVSNKYHHPQPFWYYAPVMLGLTLPFTPFLLQALWKAKNWDWRGESVLSRAQVFALAWLAFPVVFFSFSGSKLPGYVLPALPGAILLVSIELKRYLQPEQADEKSSSKRDKSSSFGTMRATGAGALLLGGGGAIYAAHELYVDWWVASVFIALPALLAAICALCAPRRRTLCFALLVAAALVIVAGVAWTGLERAANRESVRALLQTAAARGYADAPVYEMHAIERSAEFYAAARLAYQEHGDPVKLEGPTEAERIAREKQPHAILILIPVQFLYQLTNDAALQTDLIGDNGTLALAAVRAR